VEVVSESKEEPKEEANTDGASFTQYLREQGLIQTETTPEPKTTSTPAKEEKEVAKEEVKEEKAASSDDGDVKTFIDLIRSEGLL